MKQELTFNNGWIQLHRTIHKHWIWKDANKLKWWIDILLTVNHTDAKILIGSQLIECKRGQSINSLETWAKRWGVDKSKVRRFLILLENDTMIVTENVFKTTRLTVCKYDSYQGVRNDNETQVKRKRNASETQATPNNNVEEEIINKDSTLRDLCLEFHYQNPDKYKPEFYTEFIEYWTAPIQNGKNKGKELWKCEKTWDLKRRLKTSFDVVWSNKHKNQSTINQGRDGLLLN